MDNAALTTHNMPTLESALDFDSDDLTANRDGYMSQHQRDWQRRKGMRTIRWVTLVALIIDIYFVSRIVAALIRGIGDQPVGWWLFGILTDAAIVYLSIRIIGNLLRNLNADLAKGDVSMVNGAIKLHKFPYGMSVDGHRFYFRDDRALKAFENGEGYRIYYAPYSKTVLSAEPDDGTAA